jgi:hypothetical protein
MTAQLEDACGDLFDALVSLGPVQAALTDFGGDAPDRAAWDAWVAGVQRVFAAADRGWERVQPVLA